MLEEPHAVEKRQTAFRGFFTGTAEYLHLSECQIVGNGQMREEFEVLEHHADVAAQLGQVGLGIAHVDAVDEHFTLLERFQGVDGLDERGLAGAGGAADDHHFAFFYGRGAVLQNLEGTVPLAHIFDFNHRHRKKASFCGCFRKNCLSFKRSV